MTNFYDGVNILSNKSATLRSAFVYLSECPKQLLMTWTSRGLKQSYDMFVAEIKNNGSHYWMIILKYLNYTYKIQIVTYLLIPRTENIIFLKAFLLYVY